MGDPKLLNKESVLNQLRKVRIELLKSDPSLKTLLFMGVSGNEGVSSIATTFALDCCRNSQFKVALVDAHRQSSKTGNLLTTAEQTYSTATPRLYSLSDLEAGNGKDTSDSGHIKSNLSDIANKFDLIVIDAPVLGQDASTSELAGLVNGVLLVVESDTTIVDEIAVIRESLERANCRILGAIINRHGRFMPNRIWQRLCTRLNFNLPTKTRFIP